MVPQRRETRQHTPGHIWAPHGHAPTAVGHAASHGNLESFWANVSFPEVFSLALNMFLSDLLQNPEENLPMPAQAKADLRVWATAVLSVAKGLPIPHSPRPPPLSPVVFVSDAAGARFVKMKGQRIPAATPDIRGAASVGLHDDGSVWFCCRLTWPQFLLLHAKDQLGRAHGCKSTFLELVGLIQTLLTIPDRLQGREVVFLVDNLAVVYGWANGYIKNDLSASVLLRALHIILAFLDTSNTYLGCQPRRPGWPTGYPDATRPSPLTSPS
jgi:hypothetical protein